MVEAYDSLIPGAYKADLWRYCVLYIHGGDGFHLSQVTHKEHFVRDNKVDGIFGIYNGFMVCKAGNPILLQCINQIAENVNKRFYGVNPLQPTGPQLLSTFLPYTHQDVNMYFRHVLRENKTINEIFKAKFYKKPISQKKILIKKNCLESYMEYRTEQHTYCGKNNHYSYLWHDKNIYKMKYIPLKIRSFL
jgi:hypothetical protein